MKSPPTFISLVWGKARNQKMTLRTGYGGDEIDVQLGLENRASTLAATQYYS